MADCQCRAAGHRHAMVEGQARPVTANSAAVITPQFSTHQHCHRPFSFRQRFLSALRTRGLPASRLCGGQVPRHQADYGHVRQGRQVCFGRCRCHGYVRRLRRVERCEWRSLHPAAADVLASRLQGHVSVRPLRADGQLAAQPAPTHAPPRAKQRSSAAAVHGARRGAIDAR